MTKAMDAMMSHGKALHHRKKKKRGTSTKFERVSVSKSDFKMMKNPILA